MMEKLDRATSWMDWIGFCLFALLTLVHAADWLSGVPKAGFIAFLHGFAALQLFRCAVYEKRLAETRSLIRERLRIDPDEDIYGV